MTKDARSDPKYRRAATIVGKMNHILLNPRPVQKMNPVLWRRMQALRDLRLPFPVVRRLNARVTVQRALATGAEILQGVGHSLLEDWAAAEDPAHEVNRKYRYEHSGIYTAVSQRSVTRPFPIPTNKFRGRIIDMKPNAQEKGRLFDYGLELSDDDMDCGFGDISSISHEVPGSGMTPSEFSHESDEAIVPDLNRTPNQISSDSAISFFCTSVSTVFSDSRMNDVTVRPTREAFDKGVARALDKYSYPVASTPRGHQGSEIS